MQRQAKTGEKIPAQQKNNKIYEKIRSKVMILLLLPLLHINPPRQTAHSSLSQSQCQQKKQFNKNK